MLNMYTLSIIYIDFKFTALKVNNWDYEVLSNYKLLLK